ncbi:MAG: helix-turn-helix domain-containing protein, partial [Verrucomicrobiota bacterium]
LFYDCSEAHYRPNLKPGRRMDLGLALLQRRAVPGVPLTQEEIAAWAGCSKSTIWRIERRAIAKAKRALAERGFSFRIDSPE